ncbi:flagellar biosynthetic protein FliQ [Vulgatibacter sp.]|uniref:flagellar biosynthetic protein FliQ n=1 Tax=Vulgatibacter sp. TaxID=1971226 RepID=UPI0035678F17
MTPELAGGLLREGLQIALLVGGPIFAALLVAGLLVGVFQAATQINDPAVGFLPRLAAGAGICWFLGSWMAERLAAHFAEAVARMAGPF